jgi:hypothetical protein
MLCASVSFSVVVISCAKYEKIISDAYSKRVQADYIWLMMFSGEKQGEPKVGV